MTYKKILLRKTSGNPVACLTVSGRPPRVTLPQNVTAEACLVDGELLFPTEQSFVLKEDARSLSLIGKTGAETLFATTLQGEDARIAKWRLLSAVKSKKESAKKPQEPAREEAPPMPLPPTPESALARAERRIATGVPFPLFERLMPGSRWATVKEDDVEFLVGIREDDGKSRVLYGIPGAQGCPPDEGALWTYFPLDEETGYFVTEAEDA